MTAPLEGVNVLDLTRLIVGGFYGMLLADAGAEVVKVEVPGRGDTLRAWKPSWWKVYGRGKKSLTLDLTKPAGQEVLKKLAAEADVLAENFFPGKLEPWGLSPETLHEMVDHLHGELSTAPDVESAIEQARSAAGADDLDDLLVVCGSIFLVGEAREALMRRSPLKLEA